MKNFGISKEVPSRKESGSCHAHCIGERKRELAYDDGGGRPRTMSSERALRISTICCGALEIISRSMKGALTFSHNGLSFSRLSLILLRCIKICLASFAAPGFLTSLAKVRHVERKSLIQSLKPKKSGESFATPFIEGALRGSSVYIVRLVHGQCRVTC